MPEITRVGMGDYAIAKAPGEIVALGLGSCVGVSFYDPELKLGAMAHVMLPDNRVHKETENPAKFGNTAVAFLLKEMLRMGAKKEHLQIKIAGGASMFVSVSGSGSGEKDSVGARNIAAIEKSLAEEGLVLTARSVGGHTGKSVSLDLDTGELRLRTLQIESLSL